jgi:acyl-CoA thioester hydrolase
MMDKSKFKHQTQIRVRNYEVDWQGIVHNATYLLYCEVGRIEYFKQVGVTIELNAIRGPSRVVLVRNEIDYKSPALFDDLLNVYTRITFIKNSSFAMEGILEKAKSGQRVAENVAFHVWLDPSTDRPKPVPDNFRKSVQAFEGENCQIFWPTVVV